MKIGALRGIFERQQRVKLFVVTAEFCLCGYATNPRVTDAGLLVDIGSSVRFSRVTKECHQEPVCSGTLHLTDTCRMTRRIQTHRRHLETLGIPEHYSNLAETL